MFKIYVLPFAILSLLIILTTVSVAQTTDRPTATPSHPMYPYTIEGLQARDYPGGTVRIRSTMAANGSFTRYSIDYPSDGLTISGVMNVPTGAGPFPVVILLHGYYDRTSYWSGMGTWQASEFLARNGYLTLEPDFRTWGASDTGINFFRYRLNG